MQKLKVFTKKECPKCPTAKTIADEIKKEGKLAVEFFDVEQADGLAESQLYSVLATPTLVLCDQGDDENEIQSWRGEAPAGKEVIYESMS